MDRRDIRASLSVMAGGLLSAVFFPSAIASADSDDYHHAVPVPDSTQTFVGLYGYDTPAPAVSGGIQTDGTFEAVNSDGDTLGTFEAHATTIPDPNPLVILFGSTNDEYLVTDDGYYPAGSLFNTFTLGSRDSGFENIYTAVPQPGGGDEVTDIFKTPFGDIDLTPLFENYDAAWGIADNSPKPTALPPGIELHGDEDITAISGAPPVAVAVQGNQTFDALDDDGNTVSFDAANTTTSDSFGFYTQAFLVNDVNSATPDTGSGDVPPVGSVFNTINFADGFLINYYSAEPSAHGDVISDTLTTPFGTFDLSPLFQDLDAAAGVADRSPSHVFDFGEGYQIVPNHDAEFTGINGLPPGNVSIQGNESFDVKDNDGNTVGTFHAAETTSPAMITNNEAQTLLVTDVDSGTTGTEPGDVPPVGSVFDTFDLFGSGSGFVNIYSDLASSGGNVITDTLVTPFGDFDLSLFVQDLDPAGSLPDLAFP
jgi:hypothetical protein